MPEIRSQPAAIPHLWRRVAELEDDLAAAGQRMPREEDNARYESLAGAFDETGS